MKITFHGGVKEITGSNFLIEKGGEKILVDCGLFQEENVCDRENLTPFPFKAKEISSVFITHAHLDHIGRLPKLIAEGFNGYIYSTLPTKDIAREILLDCQRVITDNCSDPRIEKIYTLENVEKVFDRWRTLNYHEKFKTNNFNVEFFDAGHILGSSFIRINNTVFSGDLGNLAEDLHKNPEPLPEVDYLVLESTYGDENHENLANREEILENILEYTIRNNNILIVPAFALERSQEIIFSIRRFIKNKKIPNVKIFFDSPLAQRISTIYGKYLDYLNPKFRQLFSELSTIEDDDFKVVRTKEDEKEMFLASPPKIILSSSGMLSGGKILRIIKEYIPFQNTTILFVGYQAEGSLGRKILDGATEIMVEGEQLPVRAKILTLFSFSAHIDQAGILSWLYPKRKRLKSVFLVHGDEKSKKILKLKIMDELAIRTIIPDTNQVFIVEN
ncbi:MAG: MBL fold metallo-hydrolase [Patescibacteria group bacterium]|nr:MBL fold metallo-hydrolase [Patescibacteria group bacterium]